MPKISPLSHTLADLHEEKQLTYYIHDEKVVVEKNQQPPGIEPGTSDLSFQGSTT